MRGLKATPTADELIAWIVPGETTIGIALGAKPDIRAGEPGAEPIDVHIPIFWVLVVIADPKNEEQGPFALVWRNRIEGFAIRGKVITARSPRLWLCG